MTFLAMISKQHKLQKFIFCGFFFSFHFLLYTDSYGQSDNIDDGVVKFGEVRVVPNGPEPLFLVPSPGVVSISSEVQGVWNVNTAKSFGVVAAIPISNFFELAQALIVNRVFNGTLGSFLFYLKRKPFLMIGADPLSNTIKLFYLQFPGQVNQKLLSLEYSTAQQAINEALLILLAEDPDAEEHPIARIYLELENKPSSVDLWRSQIFLFQLFRLVKALIHTEEYFVAKARHLGRVPIEVGWTKAIRLEIAGRQKIEKTSIFEAISLQLPNELKNWSNLLNSVYQEIRFYIKNFGHNFSNSFLVNDFNPSDLVALVEKVKERRVVPNESEQLRKLRSLFVKYFGDEANNDLLVWTSAIRNALFRNMLVDILLARSASTINQRTLHDYFMVKPLAKDELSRLGNSLSMGDVRPESVPRLLTSLLPTIKR